MQRKTSGTRRKENSSPKILQPSLSRRRATLPAPGKRRILRHNPANFSFLPACHVPGAGQKENSSSKSCNLLFPATAPRFQNRAKGEFFLQNPAIFSLPLALHIPGAPGERRIFVRSPRFFLLPACLSQSSMSFRKKENFFTRSLKISSSQLAFQSSAFPEKGEFFSNILQSFSSAHASHSRRREKGEYLSGIPGSSPLSLPFILPTPEKRILAKKLQIFLLPKPNFRPGPRQRAAKFSLPARLAGYYSCDFFRYKV